MTHCYSNALPARGLVHCDMVTRACAEMQVLLLHLNLMAYFLSTCFKIQRGKCSLKSNDPEILHCSINSVIDLGFHAIITLRVTLHPPRQEADFARRAYKVSLLVVMVMVMVPRLWREGDGYTLCSLVIL